MYRLYIALLLVAACAVGNVAAQGDGREALRQSLEALRQAPAYRATVAETGTGASGLRMEVVNPNLLHLRTGMGTESSV